MESGPDRSSAHAYLVRCAELLHAHGTPAHRLERVMVIASRSLGVEASFLYTPTSVFASFGKIPHEETHLLRIESSDVDLGKLVAFDDVMDRVADREMNAGEGLAALEAIAQAPRRWNNVTRALAFGLASGGAACFFGGGIPEIALSFALGPCLLALGRVLPGNGEGVGLYEPVAAFAAAFAALLFARHVVVLDDRVVTLASLIVLVPGLTLTTAMTELATRHLVSGVSRLAGAAALFLMILLGVALAWRLGAGPVAGVSGSAGELPAWTVWIAALVMPFAFAVILEARVQEFGPIFLTGVGGFAAARLGAGALGSDLAPFAGALFVGLAANLYARLCDRPAIVPLTPGILLLVPGSLGYRSLTSFLDREALAGMEWAFQTGVVAVALVGGTLAANVVLPPRRVL